MTSPSANGHGSFDLEAAEAAALEAEGAPFAFTYAGADYAVPPSKQWPVSAFQDIAAGDLEVALSKMLGEEEFTRLADAGLRVAGLNALFEEIGRLAGLGGLPNSRQPAVRSSTPRSKRR